MADKNNRLLIHAAKCGDAIEIQRLIRLSPHNADYNGALQLAAYYGHTDCVKLLIPVSDPKANNSYALQISASYGHTDCVKLLIPVSNPKADNSRALLRAIMFKETDCIDLLIGVCDSDYIFRHLQDEYSDDISQWEYFRHKMNEKQRDVLIEHTTVKETEPSQRHKKI